MYSDRVTLIDPTPDPADQMATALVTSPTGLQSPVSNVEIDAPIQGFISRDDWVMLINRDPTAEAGFDRQVAFYRVVSATDNADGASATLTLDGPDFNFAAGPTHIVHLNNVVGVYERTFTPESESDWNIF